MNGPVLYHESAHAYLATLHGIRIEDVVVGEREGYCLCPKNDRTNPHSDEFIQISLAGVAACSHSTVSLIKEVTRVVKSNESGLNSGQDLSDAYWAINSRFQEVIGMDPQHEQITFVQIEAARALYEFLHEKEQREALWGTMSVVCNCLTSLNVGFFLKKGFHKILPHLVHVDPPELLLGASRKVRYCSAERKREFALALQQRLADVIDIAKTRKELSERVNIPAIISRFA